MRSHISTGVVISVLILLQALTSEGAIGDVCSAEAPCPLSEVCGNEGTCECQSGYGVIKNQCVIECPTLESIDNGTVTIVPNTDDLVFEALYVCVTGYEIIGEPRRRCLNTGAWEDSVPTCEKIACPSLVAPDNGTLTISDDVGEFGSIAQYNCNEGFEITSGEETRECQESKQWSGNQPKCSKSVNPCDPNPCPTPAGGQQFECVVNKENNTKHVCICPVGKKGATCEEDDQPITCREKRRKFIHFEANPDSSNKTVCLPKRNSTEENVCFNPDEGIKYRFDGANDITFDDKDLGKFCLEYTGATPTVAEYCVTITAFETDDIDYRPWINETFELCFVFNRIPKIFPPKEPLIYNVVTMPDSVSLPIETSDADNKTQTLTLSISAVGRTEFESRFSIEDDNLVISNPVELFENNQNIFGDIFTVQIKVKDNGIPQLEAIGDFNVEFLREILECTVPKDVFMVDLDPVPTEQIKLGQIQCTEAGKTVSPSFDITNEAGPVLLEADGSIFYDPSATDTEGRFRINVRANVTVSVPISTTLNFVVFAADFKPLCVPTDLPRPVEISEKADLGTCSGVTFTCDDPANISKTCTDTSDTFNVSCESVSSNIVNVRICSGISLDLKASSGEKVSITVQNEYGSQNIDVDVSITNVNDPPKIMTNETQINEEISEESTPPLVLDVVLPVADPDITTDPKLDTLSASIKDLESLETADSLPFTASITFENTISVTLSKELNPKVRHNYLLELKVEDLAGASDTVDLNITVTDINEQPKCDKIEVNTSATVRDPVNYVVTILSCTDDDFSQSFKTLQYSLVGDQNVIDYFNINENGELRLKQVLTTFTSGTNLTFSVRVTDGGGLSETVTIHVEVITSYPPECEKYEAVHKITERTDLDKCFEVIVNCNDPVNSESLTFKDPSGNGTQLFSLNSDSTTNDKISFCTLKSLQGSVGQWHINLVVTSSYGPRNIQIIVDVQDVNDAPTCTSSDINLEASATDKTDKLLDTLICSDPDTDTNFKTLEYTLEGQADVISYFKMVDGEIRVAKNLSDITAANTVLSFTIRVEDGGDLFDSVSVKVTVKTDFPPACSKTDLEIAISEATDSNVCRSVDVDCTDIVDDSLLDYEITSGNGTSLFYEKDSTNSQLKLCTSSSLQGKYGSWKIVADVKSSHGKTTLNCIIRVSDKNDYPEFAETSYTFNVLENSTINTVVATLSASDQDSGAYGSLTYQSKDVDITGLFSLNKDTGELSVAKTLDFDRSTSNSYSYIVEAVDGASIPLTASTTVVINVIDVNDEKPICTPNDVPVSLKLLTETGTVIRQLECADADKSSNFAVITYSATSAYFSVNSTGHVTLSSKLPRDITQHEVKVKVTDSDKSDDPDFSTNVVIMVNVDNKISPICTPKSTEATWDETKAVGLCLETDIICSDPTGGDVTLESQTLSGEDKDLLEIKTKDETGKLSLSACVKSSLKKKFGEFELTGTVTNGLATTNVKFVITVKNVNEPPVFSPESYNIDVYENQTLNNEILKITVSDPDDGMGDASFEFENNITVVSTNDADFGGILKDAIIFLKAVRSFYSYKEFNATARNVYKYSVTAVDRSGLKSTAAVTINVLDVNSAPICDPTQYDQTVSILAKQNDAVIKLQCYDTDLDPDNLKLTYEIVEGDADGYFDITGDGELIVRKPLPRDELLYDVGRANIRVTISDSGTPAKSTSIIATVNVSRNIPPTCNPVIIPPDVWIRNNCVTIKMDCTDPTKSGTDHLIYTLIGGNYTEGFTEKSNSQGTIELCYNNLDDGVFQVEVSVDNSLDVYKWTDNIVVRYAKATPIFTETKYTNTIPETTTAKTVVTTIKVKVNELIGTVQYNILGDGSTNGWRNYFSLDNSSGVITTVTGIRDFANQVVTLKVEAVDTKSLLRSSVLVELTVTDINEKPSCEITSTKLNVAVSEAVGTSIIVFTCRDPDVKEEFRTLTYDISGSNVDDHFKLVGEPVTSVTIKTPLNIVTFKYVISLTVTDKGTPPLSYTKDFTVDVDLLPPAIDVKATAVSFDTIKVTWDYARSAYDDVTKAFKVKALTTANIIVTVSPSLDSSIKSYEISGLSAETQYVIVVEAETDYGIQSSREQTVTTQEVPVLTDFIAIFIADENYNDRLRDKFSQVYYEYKTKVRDSVLSVLGGTPGYAGLRDVSFRRHNSIYVDIQASVNQSGNVDYTIQKLGEAVSTGTLGQMSVEPDSFQAAVGGGFILIDSLTYKPTKVYNGTELILYCNMTTVGYSEDENFEYWWTLSGNRLYPSDQSRYSSSAKPDDEFFEYKYFMLRINPIQGDMSGSYGCHVRDSSGEQVKDKVTQIKVISQPTVIIEPKSESVRYGDTVNVTCLLISIPGTFERFVWYRNGEAFLKQANEVITHLNSLMTITVTNIKESVVFGCEAKNEAGNSVRVFSNIGVIPQDAKAEDVCPEDIDYRNTMWPQSAPGIRVRLDCNDTQVYTGEVYRECSENGDWNPPLYKCVSETIATIEQNLQNIQDGFKPQNLTNVIVDLNKATTDNSLYIGDIDTTLDSLDIIIGINDTVTLEEQATRKSNILEICSSLIAEQNRKPWLSSIEVRRKGAISIPKVVEQFNIKSMEIVPKNKETMLSVENIHVTIGSGKREVYSFPDRSNTAPDWVKSSKTTIVIQGEAFKDIANVQYASSYFRNITPILVKKLKKNGKVSDVTSLYDINAPIVSFQLKENLPKVDPPAEITFEHFDSNYSNPICCYWDFMEEAFLTDGCTLISSNDEFTICQCNHFTNFAVLMSPGKTPPVDVLALSIISAVGCAISILCLLLTIILHFIVWRFVKSDRAVLLLNLCVALIIAYIIFLAGVDRVENKDGCTAVSVLLHYVYLAVFFLMLAYGIEIAISVVYVFVTRSRIKWLLPLAWCIPLVIVGISMGVTELEGYGNERFCWLSIEDGLLWAFVGPAAVIIVINFVIVVIVFRQMFKSSVMITKSDKEKAVTGVRSICVLLPILGLTWVFGIFSVNEDMVVFQYIFAICNSLQGFLIFLFHCILNKQLRHAIKQQRDRKKSLQSIENTFKTPHSTSGSTAFLSNENKLQPNKDLNSASTNPFLEADRQMKELVGNKNKKTTNVNDNFEANNKVEVDKGSRAVDLDDVKISNIIRESEVMGGTTGISSIFPADNRTEDDKINEEDIVYLRRSRSVRFSETPIVQSQMSSVHRYDYVDPSHNRLDPDKTSPHQTVGIEKPPGYEKLLQATGLANYASKDSVHSGKEKEKQRQKEREKERERERERVKKIEKEKQDRTDKERKERERMERENEERERKEREKQAREQREKDSYQERDVIRIGYTNEGYNQSATVDRRRDGSQDRRSHQRSNRSSRTDDDYESASSAQNVTSINTALPEKFEFFQGKKRQQKEAKKHSESSLKKKDKKKSSLKDRSKAYEYSYDSTYLGGNSRHASLENMNMQNLGYSAYTQMPGYSGYQTGRPTVQQQHWDQYGGYHRGPREPRDPRDYDPYARDPYRRDYW